jgi:G3E family GTPase
VNSEKALPGYDKDHYHDEVDLIEIHTQSTFNRAKLDTALKSFPKWDFYRIKGAIDLDGSWQILNFAFGKWEYVPISQAQKTSTLVLMGKNFQYHLKNLSTLLDIPAADIKLVQ